MTPAADAKRGRIPGVVVSAAIVMGAIALGLSCCIT